MTLLLKTVRRAAVLIGCVAALFLLFDVDARYGVHDDAGIGRAVCHCTLRRHAYGEDAMHLNEIGGYFRPFQGREVFFDEAAFQREVQPGTPITITYHLLGLSVEGMREFIDIRTATKVYMSEHALSWWYGPVMLGSVAIYKVLFWYGERRRTQRVV